jgi:hypothetical protein
MAQKVTLAWHEYLQEHYQIDHQAFLRLSDDVRDSICFAYLWLELPRATECPEGGHHYHVHYSPYSTSLYRCCLHCTHTEVLDIGWERYSFAQFFERLQSICWAVLSYRFWTDENRRCIEQVRKLLSYRA